MDLGLRVSDLGVFFFELSKCFFFWERDFWMDF